MQCASSLQRKLDDKSACYQMRKSAILLVKRSLFFGIQISFPRGRLCGVIPMVVDGDTTVVLAASNHRRGRSAGFILHVAAGGSRC